MNKENEPASVTAAPAAAHAASPHGRFAGKIDVLTHRHRQGITVAAHRITRQGRSFPRLHPGTTGPGKRKEAEDGPNQQRANLFLGKRRPHTLMTRRRYRWFHKVNEEKTRGRASGGRGRGAVPHSRRRPPVQPKVMSSSTRRAVIRPSPPKVLEPAQAAT